MDKLTPAHPHLLPAYRTWLSDNFQLVHIYVKADGVADPYLVDMAVNGVLVLNVSPSACRDFHVSEDSVTFSARFSGAARGVVIPNHAIVGIMGMDKHTPDDGFYVSMLEWPRRKEPEPEEPTPKPSRSHLSVVK